MSEQTEQMTPRMREMHAEMSRQTEVEARPGLPPIRAYKLEDYACCGSPDESRRREYERGLISDLGPRLMLITVYRNEQPPYAGQWIAIVGSTEAAHDEARRYLALKLGLGEEVTDDGGE